MNVTTFFAKSNIVLLFHRNYRKNRCPSFIMIHGEICGFIQPCLLSQIVGSRHRTKSTFCTEEELTFAFPLCLTKKPDCTVPCIISDLKDLCERITYVLV